MDKEFFDLIIGIYMILIIFLLIEMAWKGYI